MVQVRRPMVQVGAQMAQVRKKCAHLRHRLVRPGQWGGKPGHNGTARQKGGDPGSSPGRGQRRRFLCSPSTDAAVFVYGTLPGALSLGGYRKVVNIYQVSRAPESLIPCTGGLFCALRAPQSLIPCTGGLFRVLRGAGKALDGAGRCTNGAGPKKVRAPAPLERLRA